MSDSPSRNLNSGLSSNDTMALVMILAAAWPVVVGIAVFWARHRLVPWLVQHQILAAADTNPLWVLPGAGGAGLDLLRIVIVGCVGLGLVIVTAHRLHTAVQRRYTKDHR